MRISDWSSDVCSSDLQGARVRPRGATPPVRFARPVGHALGHAARRSPDDDDQPARRFRRRRHRARRQPGRLGHPRRPRRQRADGKEVEGESEKRKDGGMTNRGRKYMMPSFKSILLAGAAAMLPFAEPAHAAPEEAPVAEAVAAPEAETAE